MTAHASASSTAQLATLVVRWHNRHPLARPIGPEHIAGIGVVALPFAAKAANGGSAALRVAIEPPLEASGDLPTSGGSLRERALAAAAQPAGSAAPSATAPPTTAERHRAGWRFWARPRRAFEEDFVAPLSPARAGAFAAARGALADSLPADWPRREVLVDADRLKGAAADWRYLRTAAIELGERRCRVLIAADGSTAVIGPRLWSVPRCAVAAMLPLVIAAAMLVPRIEFARAVQPAVATQARAPQVAVVASEPVASVTALAIAPKEVPVIAAASAPVPAVALAAPAPAPAASSTHHVAPPAETRSDAPRVDIRPRLDPELARIARRESSALRKTGVAVVGAPAATPATPAALAAPKAASRDDGKTFALVARQTRTRAASEVLLGLMRSAAAGPTAVQAGALRTEVLPSAEGYRASWWPFLSRGDAEQARQRLAMVGLPVDLVEF